MVLESEGLFCIKIGEVKHVPEVHVPRKVQQLKMEYESGKYCPGKTTYGTFQHNTLEYFQTFRGTYDLICSQ